MVDCLACGAVYGPVDGGMGAPNCPECGERQWRLRRCDACPVAQWEREINETDRGRLLQSVLELDAAIQMKLTVTPDDMTAEQFAVLQTLTHERAEFQQEQEQQASGGQRIVSLPRTNG